MVHHFFIVLIALGFLTTLPLLLGRRSWATFFLALLGALMSTSIILSFIGEGALAYQPKVASLIHGFILAIILMMLSIFPRPLFSKPIRGLVILLGIGLPVLGWWLPFYGVAMLMLAGILALSFWSYVQVDLVGRSVLRGMLITGTYTLLGLALNTYYLNTLVPEWTAVIQMLAFLFLLAGFSYAILKHQAADSGLNLGHAAATLTMLLVSMVGFLLIQMGLAAFGVVESGVWSNLTILVYWATVVFSAERFMAWLKKRSDAILTDNALDYEAILQKITDELLLVGDVKTLYQRLYHCLHYDMGLSNVYLFVPTELEAQMRLLDKLIEAYPHPLRDASPATLTPLIQAKLFEDTSEIRQITELPLAVQDACRELLAKVLCPSITTEGELIAVLFVGPKRSGLPYQDQDYYFLRALSTLLLTTLARIRQGRIADQLKMAQTIQEEILPKETNMIGLSLSCYMKPADEVGGDYYDIVQTPERSWLMLGDVTGHGLSAGLVMFMSQSVIQTLIAQNPSISTKALAYQANQILTQNLARLSDPRPVSMVVLSTQDGRRFEISGHHEAIYIYRANTGQVERVPADHFPFGLGLDSMPEDLFESSEFSLETGDLLFVGTDGIMEAPASGDIRLGQFSEQRLMALLQEKGKAPLDEIKEALIAALDTFTNGYYMDDVTFVMARAVD